MSIRSRHLAFVFLVLVNMFGCNRGNDTSPQSPGQTQPQVDAIPSTEVFLPEQRVKFALAPGWSVAKKDIAKDHGWCLLQHKDGNAVNAVVAVWVGEKFAKEAIDGGAQNVAVPLGTGEQGDYTLGAAWASGQAISLARNEAFQPGAIKKRMEDVGWDLSLLPVIETQSDTFTGVGAFIDRKNTPLLVGWAFQPATKDATLALVTSIFAARNPDSKNKTAVKPDNGKPPAAKELTVADLAGKWSGQGIVTPAGGGIASYSLTLDIQADGRCTVFISIGTIGKQSTGTIAKKGERFLLATNNFEHPQFGLSLLAGELAAAEEGGGLPLLFLKRK